MDLVNDRLILRDFPPGPLDRYRKQANFDWKKLKLFFEDEELLTLKMRLWKFLENDPIFKNPPTEPTTEEKKRLTALRLKQYYNSKFENVRETRYKKRTRILLAQNEALAAVFPDVSIKYALGVGLFRNTIITLGTERHQHYTSSDKKILSCLALTEIAHGSNAKQMRTTATYDPAAQEFVINTPDFEAAKCWVGNLGKQCTFALLFAQLYTKGQCHGLHAFVVPIRDPSTHLPYPGIMLGDMGEKIGVHGIDNGLIIFKNYRIPRENLLNRTADVTPEGEYESSFTDPNRILGAALENLSMGRVGIITESSNNLICAITIAVRYAAIRKQFSPNGEGNNNNEELPIIEYQLHQWRLFPYMAAATVLRLFVNSFTETFLSVIEKSATMTELEDLSEMVSEIHALISSIKPLITWTCRDAVQECREACGGHGFHKSARLGDLRDTIDPSVTYEGDNNVLVQQTCNWLLRQWQAVSTGGQLTSPLGSCSFLADHGSIMRQRCVVRTIEEVETQQFIMSCYQWLLLYLLQETEKRQNAVIASGADKFMARNESQVYRAAIVTRAYGEYTALRYYWSRIATAEPALRPVLDKVGSLYGLSCLDKHLVYFYQGGYTKQEEFSKYIKDSILRLCKMLKPDSVSIVDSLAPPDYVINSVLGRSDGKLYENLKTVLMSNVSATSRPEWWREIVNDKSTVTPLQSKL